MRLVTSRDLSQRTASILAEVTKSGDVVVTECGEPRWTVSSFREQDAPLVRMERDGRYTPRHAHRRRGPLILAVRDAPPPRWRHFSRRCTGTTDR